MSEEKYVKMFEEFINENKKELEPSDIKWYKFDLENLDDPMRSAIEDVLGKEIYAVGYYDYGNKKNKKEDIKNLTYNIEKNGKTIKHLDDNFNKMAPANTVLVHYELNGENMVVFTMPGTQMVLSDKKHK